MAGLILLHENVPISDKYFWDGNRLLDSFAEFLRLVLDEHWQEVISEALAKSAFMTFALKLGSLQHPLGGEILTQAGARLGMSQDG